MSGDIETVKGSGNVFRDFGHENADLEQLKSILAAKIIGVLDDKDMSVRKAQAMTGIAAADFSRIRNAQLDRFTVDRLMTVLNRLNHRVKVQVSVRPSSKLARDRDAFLEAVRRPPKPARKLVAALKRYRDLLG